MKEQKNILLVGRTGTGKSTIANVLLNSKNEFKESSSLKSETKKCQYGTSQLFGIKDYPYVKVIDTPGFMDTSGDDDSNLLDIYNMLVSIKDEGINLILFCFSALDVRCDKGTIDSLKILKSLMGEEVLKRIYLVITQLNKIENKDRQNKCSEIAQQIPYVLKKAGIAINTNPIIAYHHQQQNDGLKQISQLLKESQKFFPKILKDLRECYDPSDNLKTMQALIASSKEMQNVTLQIHHEKQQRIMQEKQNQERLAAMQKAIQLEKSQRIQLMDQIRIKHEEEKKQLFKQQDFQQQNIQEIKQENIQLRQSDNNLNPVASSLHHVKNNQEQLIPRHKQQKDDEQQFIKQQQEQANRKKQDKNEIVNFLVGTIPFWFGRDEHVKMINKVIDL